MKKINGFLAEYDHLIRKLMLTGISVLGGVCIFFITRYIQNNDCDHKEIKTAVMLVKEMVIEIRADKKGSNDLINMQLLQQQKQIDELRQRYVFKRNKNNETTYYPSYPSISNSLTLK